MGTWVARTGQVFESVDWFVPAYMQAGILTKLATDIAAAPQNEKASVLEKGLRRHYNPAYLAAMLLYRYRVVDHVREFAEQIRESIEAWAGGLDLAAVATLLPVIEGVLRKMAAVDGRDLGPGTRKVADEIDRMIDAERARTGDSPNDATFERIEMLKQLCGFMRNRLLAKTSEYSGIDDLNRHGISHGIFLDYGKATNFLKLISFLDGLVFVISLRMSGVSCLAPDDTPSSRKLALYFVCLSSLRRLRAAAFPEPLR